MAPNASKVVVPSLRSQGRNCFAAAYLWSHRSLASRFRFRGAAFQRLLKKRGAFETEAVRVLPRELETDRERGARESL
jgi:hypothetical protein